MSQSASKSVCQPVSRSVSQQVGQLGSEAFRLAFYHPPRQSARQSHGLPSKFHGATQPSQTVRLSVCHPVSEPVIQEFSLVFNQPARQPGSLPVNRSVSRPASYRFHQPDIHPSSQPATRPSYPSAFHAVGQSVSRPGSHPFSQSANRPVNQ